MKKTMLIAAIVILSAASCNQKSKSQFERRVADYAVVEIPTPDLSGITDNGKEVTTVPGTALRGNRS